jgi:hypothetical protein
MKIGLSFSRCILDIIEGRVEEEDVLVIISRTNFDPTKDEHWSEIWTGYLFGGSSAAEWYRHINDEEKFRELTVRLYKDGKLHQPRQFGAHPSRRNEYWLETVLPSSELDRNPAAKKAWDHFQMVAGLTNVNLDKEYN